MVESVNDSTHQRRFETRKIPAISRVTTVKRAVQHLMELVAEHPVGSEE